MIIKNRNDFQVSHTDSPDNLRVLIARTLASASAPENVPLNLISLSSGPSRSTTRCPDASLCIASRYSPPNWIDDGTSKLCKLIEPICIGESCTVLAFSSF